MCGIAGIIHFNNTNVSDQQLMNMGKAIQHRGPDDNGIWNNGAIGFAHQRLSIIDTSTGGHQPMHSPDGQYTIVFNGEIYNHNEFRTELTQKGFQFHSTTDTEVLLYLYITYGTQMLERLNGMFAFAIWDNTKQELFICRDRMGVKPLYYSSTTDSVYFASEPKALFAAGVNKEIDQTHMNEWLLYRYIAGEHTLLKGVHKLLPGHCILVKQDGSKQFKRWYHLGEHIQQHAPITHPQSWFEETFHSAVKYRMVADVPVGLLLSGGLDSSSIAASLSLSGFKNIHTFNIAFKDSAHDESTLAGNFSNSLGFPFHRLYLENKELHHALLNAVYHLDEPLIHMNDPHLLAIANYARDHVKVLLSGEGADELMGGYVRHKTSRIFPLRQQLHFILSHTPNGWKDSRTRKLERYLNQSSTDQLILSNAANYFEGDFNQLGLDLGIIHNPYRSNVLAEAKQVYPTNTTHQLLYYDQHTYLQSLNERNDRSTMAASIECREPFQDYRLVEGIGSLDTKWLTKGQKGKYILAQSMKNILPHSILSFKKIGLSVPWMDQILESEWLKDEWEKFVEHPTLGVQLLDKVSIKPIIGQMNKGIKTPYDSLMLQYFMFFIWKNTYFNNPS
jgi:asparagine synthase (glutamine-hydrolysing)